MFGKGGPCPTRPADPASTATDSNTITVSLMEGYALSFAASSDVSAIASEEIPTYTWGLSYGMVW